MNNFKLFIVILKLLINNFVYAKDEVTIDFLMSYISNENKPTSLVSGNLCWKKYEKLNLFKQLSEAGIRTSSVFIETFSYQDHALLHLIDLDCPNAEVALNVSKQLRFPYRWLVLHEQRQLNSYDVRNLWDLPLLADSEFVLAIRNGDKFTLSELHKPSTFGPTYSNPRGTYNEVFKDTRPNRELFRRRKNVMGHPLTMANVIQDSNSSLYHLPREDRLYTWHAPLTECCHKMAPLASLIWRTNLFTCTRIFRKNVTAYFYPLRPFTPNDSTSMENTKELEFDPIAKLSWMHVHIAFQMLNATPKYIFSHRWGYKRNGQWSGMINDIKTGRADLGTNCVASSDRLSIVVYTDSISKFKVKFIFRQPPLSYISNIFALPFSLDVWIAIILCVIISTITIFLATKWEALRLGTTQAQMDGSIGDAMLLTISALSQQGCSKEPKKTSGRIMLFVVFTSLMALYAAYSANIVVLLQAPSDSIKTLEQLVNSKMTIAALDVDYNRFVLKAQKDPIRRMIYKKIEPDKGKSQYYTLNEGVARLREGLFAFHSLMDSVYRRMEETYLEIEKCGLMEVDFMNALDPFVPVYKHSPYLELLRVAFKRIHESGIQTALHKRIYVPKPRCTDKMAAFSSVSLPNIRPVLLFMIYGITASVIILVIEISVHKMSIKKRRAIKTNRDT